MKQWRMAVFSLAAVSLAAAVASCSPGSSVAQATQEVEGWREDLESFLTQAELAHDDLYNTISQQELASSVQDLQSRLPSLERHEVIVEISRIVTQIGDGHTGLWLVPNSRNAFRDLPVEFYRFGDELRVVGIEPSQRNLLGGRLVSIDGVPAAEAYERVAEVTPYDNEWTILDRGPRLLAVMEVLHALSIAEDLDGASFEIETMEGETVTTELAPGPVSDAGYTRDFSSLTPANDGRPGLVTLMSAGDSTPLYLQDQDMLVKSEYLADDDLLYVRISTIRNGERRLGELVEAAIAEGEGQGADRLVLDIRNNGGGNNYLSYEVIPHVVASRFNQTGSLFVIIGRRTFSAASHLTSKLELDTEAIFVGEPTGASPNHYGDAPPVRLSNLGEQVAMSGLFWQNTRPYPFETRTTAYPDVSAELTFEDYRTGRDPALDATAGYEEHLRLRDVVETSYDEGGLETAMAAYRAYRAQPRYRFANYPLELEYAGGRVAGKGEEHQEAARRLYRESLEHQPDNPSIYEAIGDTYWEEGRFDEARTWWERVLESDDQGLLKGRALLRLNRDTPEGQR